MLFPTLNFAIFFLIVYGLSWAVHDRPQLRKTILVVASYTFYAQWDWRFTGLLFGSSLLNYGAGLWIDRTKSERLRRLIVAAAVALNLGVLAFFKYFDFFVFSLNQFLYEIGFESEIHLLSVVLPVGISFFTFHGISYIVDITRRQIKPCRSLVDLLLYISFFPQLVAGPIVRAAYFLPQIQASVDPRRVCASWGLLMILVGLFKKVVVAQYLAATLVDEVFADPSQYGAGDVLLAAYGYAFQIYCDFSGYSDMAMGIAALLGYRFPPNFNQPYRSASLQEFWRRWHISLSSWLRDYLYKPLGGNQHGMLRTCRNLMITMVLGGLWHGASWTFVAWGGLHGLALIVERLIGGTAQRWRWLAVPIVFHFVCLTWILFRAQDFETAWLYLSRFLEVTTPVTLATPFILGLLSIGLLMQFLPPQGMKWAEAVFRCLPAPAKGLAIGLVLLVIQAIGPEGVAPFIYFQF